MVSVDLTLENASGIVPGWGRANETGKPSDIMREIEIPLIDNDKCIKSSLYTSKDILPGMFCAGDQNAQVDACKV